MGITEGLNRVQLFEGLTPAQLAWIGSRLYERVFPPDVDLIVAGTPGEVIYFILSGTVKVYITQANGTDVIVNIMGPGDTVGELSVLDSGGRSASVITLEETHAAWMSRSHFQEALQTFPLLSNNLLKILSGRLRHTTEKIQTLASLSIPERVIQQLLIIAENYGRVRPQGIFIPIRLTQGEIAELVGASRKRVNQVMVALKRDGLVSSDAESHITLHDAEALQNWKEG
jgi:CRP/FNR family transcriptional regulator, cyclic AMP receptor protein